MTKVLPSDEGYPSNGGDGANSTVAGEGEIGQDKAKDDHLDNGNRLTKKTHPEPSDANFGEDHNRRQVTVKNEKFDPDPSKEDILQKMLASRGVSKDSGNGGPHSSRTFKLVEHDDESTTLKHEKRLSSNHGSIDPGSEKPCDSSMELHADVEESSAATRSTLSQQSGTHRLTRPSSKKYARESKMLLGNAEQNPLKVPGVIFMEHPAQSKAATLLRRHGRRVEDVRAKKGKVEELMKLVMDHDPDISESPLPDIDKVFPMNRSSDKLQSDFHV